MFNQIKSDFYRLFQSKGFYITLGVVVAYTLLIVLTQTMAGVMVEGDTAVEMGNTQAALWTGSVALTNLLDMFSTLPFFMIPLFLIIVGYDFSMGTYKNTLTTGISRTKYFFAKYLTVVIAALFVVIIYLGLGYLIAGLKNGFGETTNVFWMAIIQNIGIKCFALLLLMLLATAVQVTTTSQIVAVLVIALLPIILQLFGIIPPLDKLEIYRFNPFLFMDITPGTILPKELLTSLTISSTMITVGLFVGTPLIFKKKEF